DQKNEFSIQEKEDFIEKFILIFAPTFQNQFIQVIAKLQEKNLGSSFDEAVFYYSNIADFLRKLVAMNPEVDQRVCTQKQIIDYIKNGKMLVFNSAFREYKGEVDYFNFVKNKFIRPKRNHENFIF